MEFNGSLAATLVLCAVHVSVKHWRFLDGPRGHQWLSVAAGTALAYVFTYLLPKLAVVQQEIAEVQGPFSGFLRQQAYLLALIGLVTLFSVDKAAARMPRDTNAQWTRGLVLQAVIYGIYSVQLGYLLASFRQPEVTTYVLAAAVLGLHLMGIDHHIAHRHASAFSAVLRWVFAACCIVGWAIGAFTADFEHAVMLSNTFVAGGIIVVAIREELRDRHSTLLPFFAAVVLASAAIIAVQILQGGAH
jgi:hypothetical protein